MHNSLYDCGTRNAGPASAQDRRSDFKIDCLILGRIVWFQDRLSDIETGYTQGQQIVMVDPPKYRNTRDTIVKCSKAGPELFSCCARLMWQGPYKQAFIAPQPPHTTGEPKKFDTTQDTILEYVTS